MTTGLGEGGLDEAEMLPLLDRAAGLDEAEFARFLKGLPAPVRRRIDVAWRLRAHRGQREPKGDWRVWLMMAGRGFGKTRAGAEWVWARVRAAEEGQIAGVPVEALRIALVGANMDDVEKVMVQGESGLIACARTGEEPKWVASRRMVAFPSGARAFAYSGERPEKLRGPQHHFAWCDELAKWAYPDRTWDNLMLGLRLGARPRAVATTTPKPIPLLKRIRREERVTTTRGRTAENVHLSEDWKAAVTAMYAGTRLGRQELDGELIEDVEGALWTRDLIERCRVPFDTARDRLRDAASTGSAAPQDERSSLRRVVIGVDPPASHEGTCGIVVAGVAGEAPDEIAYVLDDASRAGGSPEGWAGAVAAAAARWRAHRVVAEANNGGRMVESVMRAAEPHLPIRLVHASEGKAARAEPVAALFERGRTKLAGHFPELEDELAGLTVRGGYEGPGRSPDRADACVWALTELMLGEAKAGPRVRLL